jgi:hypothetical protein
MPEQSEQNDDWNRYAQQPQQDRSAHIFLLRIGANVRIRAMNICCASCVPRTSVQSESTGDTTAGVLCAVQRNRRNEPAIYVHTDMRDRGEMLTIAEAQQRTQLFLTGQMIEALQAVEYELPSFETEPRIVQLSVAARSRVEIRRVPGASDATYLVNCFGD